MKGTIIRLLIITDFSNAGTKQRCLYFTSDRLQIWNMRFSYLAVQLNRIITGAISFSYL